MEHLTTGILRRSSDAVVIVDLTDGRILDVNEAFFTATGHARHELVGRPGHALLVGFGQTAGTLEQLGANHGCAHRSVDPLGRAARRRPVGARARD
jgi:PAS domain-containing protein